MKIKKKKRKFRKRAWVQKENRKIETVAELQVD